MDTSHIVLLLAIKCSFLQKSLSGVLVVPELVHWYSIPDVVDHLCFNVTISKNSILQKPILLLTSGALPCMFFLMSHKIRNISPSSGPLTTSPTLNFIVK